jgi:hypothetical protein
MNTTQYEYVMNEIRLLNLIAEILSTAEGASLELWTFVQNEIKSREDFIAFEMKN